MRFARPTLVVVALAACVAVAASQAGTLAKPRAAKFVVDTLTGWDASNDDTICEFGYPDTATYGQTITVPNGYPVLTSFAFLMFVPSTNVFRGEVYAWNGSRATGSKLWQSGQMSTSSSAKEVVKFNPGAKLVPGDEYIIFATVSKDFAASNGTDQGCWGAAHTSYGGGGFFYQNNGGDPTTWRNQDWDTCCGDDVAFRAVFTAG